MNTQPASKTPSARCTRCLKPARACYCARLRPFRSRLKFVILQHPNERRRSIGTGRMTHLCLENSLLIPGAEFAKNGEVNQLIANNSCVLLYPGAASRDISVESPELAQSLLPCPPHELVIFVLDGTWTTAQSMLRRSPNLQSIPRICFSSEQPSGYGFRRQPGKQCFSTIEAVSKILDHLDPRDDAKVLLELFSAMVQDQLQFTPWGTANEEKGSAVNRDNYGVFGEYSKTVACGP